MTRATDQLLDEARGERAMVWVVAIMLFLTVLAAAGGIGIARASATLGTDLAGRATVELPAGVAAEAAAGWLAARPEVAAARAVPAAELQRLLGPWLGSAAGDPSLPLPALVDVRLVPGAQAATLADAVAGRFRGARVDLHAAALAPLSRLLVSAASLAFALVAMMVAATAAVVVLSARAGLAAHRGTIDVMHMLGATDVQVARLFQRRVARDVALGTAIGALAGAGVVGVIGVQVARLGSAVTGDAALGAGGWSALAALPFAFVALAVVAARRAVTVALAQAL